MNQSIDIERPADLLEYLRRTGRVAPGETVEMRTLAGGVSNRAVLVKRENGDAWVIKQALPKLRVAVDWFSDVRRIEREAEALRRLPALAPGGSITPLVFEDRAEHLLAMQAVPEPHENWKTMLLAGRLDRRHVEQFAALLGSIHRRAAESQQPLREIFDDTTFFESLRVEPYYAYTAERVAEAGDFLRALIAETRAMRLTLVHGDYSPKNALIHADRIVLLDHEVIHWGDPAFDVGFALTHLLSKAHHLRKHRDAFLSAALEFRSVYAAAMGPVYWDANLEMMSLRHTLACMLARVAGRSPLEYLSPDEKQRQREVIVAMMNAPTLPETLLEMIQLLFFGIQTHEHH